MNIYIKRSVYFFDKFTMKKINRNKEKRHQHKNADDDNFKS